MSITISMHDEIAAAFAAVAGDPEHQECLDDCQLLYQACVDAGRNDCRIRLEACINACPQGLDGGPEALASLLADLAVIERRHGW